MCDIEDVHDLDVILYVDKSQKANLLSILSLSETSNNTYYNNDMLRISLNINNTHVCAFITTNLSKFGNSEITYRGVQLKPMMSIIETKSKMGRPKDKNHITKYAMDILKLND